MIGLYVFVELRCIYTLGHSEFLYVRIYQRYVQQKLFHAHCTKTFVQQKDT